MTKKITPFSTANACLQEAIKLLGDGPPTDSNLSPEQVTNAQDAIIHALGALERGAFRYHPTDQVDQTIGVQLFRQETIDDTAAHAYRHLHSIVGPIIDFETPSADDVARLVPVLRDFIQIHYGAALKAEKQT